MDFSYQTYVQRYNYDPFCWPPDLGLAQLHARCSEPGLVNLLGVKCPCCGRISKKILEKWWKRKITTDLKQYGAAIPGYFQLMIFYGIFILVVLLINSLYPIYASYYTCENLDASKIYCLDVGFLYYIDFNSMINVLKLNQQTQMVNILMLLQTIVFYLLLVANFLSIFYITLLNQSARQQIKENRSSKASRMLIFHHVPEQQLNKFIDEERKNSSNSQIGRVIRLYDIKKYYQCFRLRNKVYYQILSLYVIPKNPLLADSLNAKLLKFQSELLKQKKKFQQFSGKIIIQFSTLEAKQQMLKIYKVKTMKRWEYGFITIMKDLGMQQSTGPKQICAIPLSYGSDLKWENIGEDLGPRTASRFKTFLVSAILILVCYLLLYYPILFSMKTHVKQQTQMFVRLNTFQKILPNITSIILVVISLQFKKYMEKLGDQRSPKDQLEKSTFVLLSTLTFHIIFFVLLPTFFFMIPNFISPTVKLYVITQQARTFVIIQLIVVLVDMPYRFWKDKKIRNLSDQRYAFRNNQKSLHDSVQSMDYPLQARVLVLLRVWSLALFYSFFSAYLLFYLLLAFTIIFWTEKRNLYKHYSVRRKISIKLFSEVLIYFVNFFSLFICFIYCYSIERNTTKIILAILFTLGSVVGNIVYWIILNKQTEDEAKVQSRQSSSSLSEQQKSNRQSLLIQSSQKNINVWSSSENLELQYKKFINHLQNDVLDDEVNSYLDKVKNLAENSKLIKRTVTIEMQNYRLSDQEHKSEDEDDDYVKNLDYTSD